MNLKPLLIGAGAAAAIAVVIKRREAAQTVKSAVNAVTPGGGEEQPHERYEPPIEALAQEPRTPGDPPSSEARVLPPDAVVSPGDALNEPDHGPPEGAVMPDTSDDDPLVREQEKAAEGDAASIGGSSSQLGIDGEDFENFEGREETERSNREIEP